MLQLFSKHVVIGTFCINSLWDKYCYQTIFTNEEMEAKERWSNQSKIKQPVGGRIHIFPQAARFPNSYYTAWIFKESNQENWLSWEYYIESTNMAVFLPLYNKD